MKYLKHLPALLLGALFALPALADVTWFWRAEGTTLSGTDDKSAGDTTATANGGVSISATAAKVGSNGILTTDANDYYEFASASISITSQGAAGGWIQFKTALPGSSNNHPLRLADSGASTNGLNIGTNTGNDARFRMSRTGSSDIDLSATNCNFALDTWYFIIVRWHIANDDRKVECYNSSGTLIDSNEDLTTDLSANEPSAHDVIRWGGGSSANPVWIDNLFISQEYAEPIENFMSITSFVPTYTAGPTNGSFTSTTLPFTYTPDQNGTTYAAACTNGQTITTFANLKTGTCSGGAAPGTGTDTSLAGVGDTVTITGLTASTTYDVYIGHESDIGGQSAISSLPDRTTSAAGGVVLSSVNVTALTNGFNVAGTCTGSGTLTAEAVACAPGDATPTSNEVEAGQCGGGNAALMNASETWTTGVGNDFNMTSANKPPKLDVYVSCTNGTSDSSVDPQLDELRTATSGYQIVCPSSLSSTSIFDCATCVNGGSGDAYFDPDYAVNDCTEIALETNEDANCDIAMEADGDIVMTPAVGGACDGRRTINSFHEDYSSATDALFVAPTGGFTTPDLICNGNNAPASVGEPESAILLLVQNVAMPAQDLTSLVGDVDSGDTFAFTETGAGSLPTGVTLGGTGNKDMSGTPTVEDEAGQALQYTRTDACGATGTFNQTVYVVLTFAAPNCVGDTLAQCSTEMLAVAPWRAFDVGISVDALLCTAGVPAGQITAQDPAAASAMAPSDPLGVTVAASGCGEGNVIYLKRRRNATRIIQ